MKLFNETKRGYRYNILIFSIMMFIILITVLSIMYKYNFDFSVHPYFKCNQPLCENPFYQLYECKQQLTILGIIPYYTTEDCKLKNTWMYDKFLMQGEYGDKPDDFLLMNMHWFVLILITISVLLNHYLYNKGKKFDIEIKISENNRINIDSIKKWYGEMRETAKNNREN